MLNKKNIKKATALSFLLVAGIFILAHGAIPHHHHDGIPVAAAHHEHDGNAPDHQKTDNLHEFLLSTKANTRLGNDKQSFESHDSDFDQIPLPCFLTLFFGYSISTKDNVGLPFAHPPYIQFRHTAFIARSTGLRAPPFSIKN